MVVKSDQCMFGLLSKEGKLVKKPTGFLTNSPQVARELSRVCNKRHGHQPLKGGSRCRDAQVYPPELCKAICKGAAREREYRSRGLFAFGVVDTKGVDPITQTHFEGEHEEDMPCKEEELEGWGGYGGEAKYFASVTGKPLVT